MNRKRIPAFAVLFALVWSLAPIPAYAGPISACGTLNIENEIYTLMQNVSSTGTCFTVGANNITLDGAGHRINYSEASAGYGVDNSGGYDTITIKNLNIRQISSSASAHAIYSVGMTGSNIINNTIQTLGNTAHGVYLYSSSSSNTVANNTITVYGGSLTTAVMIQTSSSSNLVSGNILNLQGSSNAGVVIQTSASNSNTISNNTITGNGWGVWIGNSAGYYTKILDNRINTTTGQSGIEFMASTTVNSYLNISDNDITHSGYYGIYLWKGNSNTISNNNITSTEFNGAAIWFRTSDSNNITNNRIKATGTGASKGVQNNPGNYNIFINNTFESSGTDSASFAININSYTKIIGGSATAQTNEYFMDSSLSASSNVTAVNFSAPKKIRFAAADAKFNYNNETGGNVWLRTGVLATGTITRTLAKWSNTSMRWNDSATITATYSLSGLVSNAIYVIYNASAGSRTKAYELSADSGGNLPTFNIALNGNTEITMYPITLINVSTNATSYKSNSTVLIRGAIDRIKSGLSAPMNGTLDVYIVSFNGSRLEAEINNSGAWTTGYLELSDVLVYPFEARWNTSQHDDGTYTVYAEFNYTEFGEQLQAKNTTTFLINPVRIWNSAIDVVFTKTGIANITFGGVQMLGNGTYFATSVKPDITSFSTVAKINFPEGILLKVYSGLSKITVSSSQPFNPVLYLKSSFTNYYNDSEHAFSGSGLQFNSILNLTDVYSAQNGVAVIGRNLNISVYSTAYKEIRLYNVTEFEIYVHSGDYTASLIEKNLYLNPPSMLLGTPYGTKGISLDGIQALSALPYSAVRSRFAGSNNFNITVENTGISIGKKIPSNMNVFVTSQPASILERNGSVTETRINIAVWMGSDYA